MAKKEVLIEVDIETKGLNKNLQKANKSVKQFGNNIDKNISKRKGAVTEIGNAFSSLGGSMGGAINGVKGLNKSLLTLVANPIGAVITAIVVAVTALYKAFTSTKEGAEQVEAIMAGLSATVDVLRDRFLKLASALGSLLSGDFTEAQKQFEEATKGVVEEIAKEATTAFELTRQLQKLKDAERDLSVERAKANAELAEARLIAEDTNATFEDRIDALDRVIKKEDELLEKELKNAEETLRIKKELADQSDSDSDTLDELAQAEIRVSNLREQSVNREKRVQAQRSALIKQQEAERKASFEAEKKRIEELEKLRLKNSLSDIEYQAERAKILADTDLEIFNIEQKLLNDKLSLYDKDSEEYKNLLRKKKLEQLKFEQEITKATIEGSVQREKAQIQGVKQTEEVIKKSLKDVATAFQEFMNTSLGQSLQQSLQSAVQISNELIAGQREQLQAELTRQTNAIEENQTRQEAIINSRLERGLITEQQANIEREKLAKDQEAKKAKLEKQAFEKKKKLDISQAIMNTSLAVLNALATTTPFFAGIIASATAGALGAVQIANIKRQKFAKGGVLNGASHAQGGIPTPYGELEGGEAVINKKSTAMFKPILSALNQAGGGVKFESGGVLGTSTPTATGESTDLVGILDNLNKTLQTPVKSYVVETEITNSQNTVSNIEDRATI